MTGALERERKVKDGREKEWRQEEQSVSINKNKEGSD